MNVWWCEVHESVTLNRDEWSGRCHLGSSELDSWQSWDDPPACVLVERQLAPLDARIVGAEDLVIEKVDGMWPSRAIETIGMVLFERGGYIGTPNPALFADVNAALNVLALSKPSEAG